MTKPLDHHSAQTWWEGRPSRDSMTGVVIGYTVIITVGLLTGIMTGMTAGTMVIGMNIGLLSIFSLPAIVTNQAEPPATAHSKMTDAAACT